MSQREADIRSKPPSGQGITTDFNEGKSLTGNGNSNGNGIGSERNLSDAIESLPDIMAKKANLEAHTNILQVRTYVHAYI